MLRGYCSKYSEKLGSWMLAKLRLWAAGDEHSQPSSILEKFIDSIGVKNGEQPTPSCFFPWKIFKHGKSTPRFLWLRVQMFSAFHSFHENVWIKMFHEKICNRNSQQSYSGESKAQIWCLSCLLKLNAEDCIEEQVNQQAINQCQSKFLLKQQQQKRFSTGGR